MPPLPVNLHTVVSPSSATSNQVQSQASAYYGHDYATEAGLHQADGGTSPDYRLVAVIVEYMMFKMEPTDRCLRMPGDIYPATGPPPGVRAGNGAKGTEPWDGVSACPPPGPEK